MATVFVIGLHILPTDTSIWTDSLAWCTIYRTVYTLASSIQERNLQCWKGAVDNKTALWVAGAFPVFMSPDAATLKIMHALKDAKCSGKMPCLLSKLLKYLSKTVSNNIQSAKNKQEKNCISKESVYLPQHCEVPQPYLYHSYGTALWSEVQGF